MPSAATYTQKGRPLILTTPLGADALLAVGFTATEGLSQPFRYIVETKAQRGTDIAFDKLLGQGATITLELPAKKVRHFHGIVVRAQQGESDPDFTSYQLDLVPAFWLLTKKAQSRIFQHLNVPDILKKVLAGIPVEYKLPGTWHPRDFCVQYRETDFNFASRLMEEEGIYYYFRHEANQHVMVVANTPESHLDVPGAKDVVYQNISHESAQDEDHIYDLSKVQEQVSGKFLLWDHCFELPHQHLEAEKQVTDSVAVGQVTHKLKVGDNGKLEMYDWPGEYAQRFDGINKGGDEQTPELQKITEDNKRMVGLRMQAEAATAVSIRGTGTARQLAAGHKFTLATRSKDLVSTPIKAEGAYVLTAVTHSARLSSSYRTGTAGDGFRYDNTFTAIPLALPFRPQRATPKPVVSGTQTAVVVGPPGEEIFTDKYGRIKVQFHWDREGKKDADSSCWIRVVHVSAGRHWGAFHLPRVGQEVVIDFQEGDPDQPICLGCVYNPDQMPMYKLPVEKTKSYIRTNTSPGGVGHNEIRFEDKKGKEQIYVHAEKNMDVRVKNDSMERVIGNRHLIVGWEKDGKKGGDQREEVFQDQHLKVHRNKEEHVGGNVKFLVGGIDDGQGDMDVHLKGDKKELIDGTSDLHVKQETTELYDSSYHLHVKSTHVRKFDGSLDTIIRNDRLTKIGGDDHLTIDGDYAEKTGLTHSVDAGKEIILKAGMKVLIEAGMELTIKAGTGFIKLDATGVTIVGALVNINSGGAPGTGIPLRPVQPTEADDAANAADANPTKPTEADNSKTGQKSN